jgi:hypothetical protein
MICEFLLLYSSVYLVFLSVKECCRYVEEDAIETRCASVLYKDVQMPSYGGDECCICLDTFEKETVVSVFPCNHFICKRCFDAWIDEKDDGDVLYLKCPLCNAEVIQTGR